MRSVSRLALLLSFALTPACGGGGAGTPAPGPTLPLAFNPANFVGGPIDNPFFPLPVGTTYTHAGTTDDGEVETTNEVTTDVKVILGVTCVVVHALETHDGELVEDTLDWFAQDVFGNVWYLGEDSKDIENGVVVSTEGSWEAGVAGAQAGILMLASPVVGQAYHQEFALGIAEDMARIVGLGGTQTTPLDTFTGCLATEEFTSLEPGVLSGKHYAAGVGLVVDVNADGSRLELVSVTP